MPDDERDERTPWARYVLAGTVGLALLGMTYVLFDPDLGTAVPLFQEFTCRGRFDLAITSGFYEPFLRVPASGLYIRSSVGGVLVPSYVWIELREGEGDWEELAQHAVPTGEESYFLPTVTEETQARVTLKALESFTFR